jgi:hypothetical protein
MAQRRSPQARKPGRPSGPTSRNRPLGLKLTAEEYAAVETIQVAKGLKALALVFRPALKQILHEARRIRRGLSRVQ